MNKVMCGIANPWVRFLPPNQHDDLSLLPSRKPEPSSADFQPGLAESERMAPLGSPASESRSTPTVQRLPSDTQKGCCKEKEFPEDPQRRKQMFSPSR